MPSRMSYESSWAPAKKRFVQMLALAAMLIPSCSAIRGLV